MSILLRVIMVGLVIWGLWRIYTALYPSAPRRSLRTDAKDDWQEVLEAIEELPETTTAHRRTQDHDPPVPKELSQPEETVSSAAIESVMVHEAEAALSVIREGDENERLAAYHEIAIYDKLCAMADGHISEATKQKIDDIHQRALEMICPPDEDY